MAIIPEGKYVTDNCMQTLIQLVKNQFNASLNNTIITRISKSDYESLDPKNPNTVYYVTDISTGKVECYLGDTKISGEGGGGDEVYGIPFVGNSLHPLGHVSLVEELYINGTAVITINLFDYDLQSASYNDSAGTLTPGGSYPSTLDYVPSDGIGSVTLHVYDTSNNGLRWAVYGYDANKSYLYNETSSSGLYSWSNNGATKTVPAAVKYLRFIINGVSSPSNVREAWYQSLGPDITPL